MKEGWLKDKNNPYGFGNNKCKYVFSHQTLIHECSYILLARPNTNIGKLLYNIFVSLFHEI